MRIYSDASTRRLQDFADQIGVRCQIRKIEAHQDGKYFIISVEDQPLKWPVALGFTDDQAQYALKRRSWERFAVRAEDNKLGSSPSPSPTRRFSKRRRFPW
jgi:hypothetical protein